MYDVTQPDPGPMELVVAEDGSIPVTQLSSLGLRPGAHLRVVETVPSQPSDDLEGSLADFPDITWEDFERASSLAAKDAAGQ